MEKEYYRITSNNIGIYEYFKQYLWKNYSNALDIWNEFIESENANWLKKPEVYMDALKKYCSYFNEDGYNIFCEKTLPVILKFIDKDDIIIEKFKVDISKIVYEDEYQIVIEKD